MDVKHVSGGRTEAADGVPRTDTPVAPAGRGMEAVISASFVLLLIAAMARFRARSPSPDSPPERGRSPPC
ncbi:hypothetical protein ABT168_10495 [Streptomyces sp. NPDC001793]|uniref:hypothetical protein n=1 Tax=Streptomyces sp. NPDC001793 TaxID=3154657 RepID=UPI0033275098